MMIKIYSYDKYRERTNNSLLQFFKDYLGYTDSFEEADLNVKLHYTKEFIEQIDKHKSDKIAIIGDYDVDGITSTAIMYKGLRKYGIKDVYTLIPNRFSDGYGMNEDLVDKCKDLGVSLIITVDNGVRAFEAIRKANSLGIEVIVTDHHLPDDVLPEALININPHIGNSNLKTENICGAMTAYLLINQLLGNADINELLVLASIGTICDVMPLINENRMAVKKLIDLITTNETTFNLGLDILFKELKLSFKYFNVENISFTVGPMLNASGRLKSADLALDILINDDSLKLLGLVRELIAINDERKLISNDIKAKAKALIKEDDLSNIIFIDEANEGLVGLCASSICEETKKPTFIFTSSEDGYVKGSGRSPLWCNLIEGVSTFIEDLKPIAYGGHSGAMGLTLAKKEDLISFKKKLDEIIAKTVHEEELETYLRYPENYSINEVKDLLEELNPFGEGLKEPTFVIRAQIFNACPLGKGHSKINLMINNMSVQGLYFFHQFDYSMNGIHDIFFNIKKEFSSYSRRVEYKLFIKNII